METTYNNANLDSFFGLTKAGFTAYLTNFVKDYYVVAKFFIAVIWHFTNFCSRLILNSIAFFHTGSRLRLLLSVSIIYFVIRISGVKFSYALHAIANYLF